MAKSEFLKIFKERGFFHQCTDEEGLDKLLSSEPVTTYIGFDCTATSLHVGSLMQIMVLRWLKKLGHKPIILLGGATTKIGDPSGKDESRPKITDETIANNMAGIRKVFDQFGLESAQMVNNNDWLSKISYLDLLSEYGRHFSVNKMLSFDSVKMRLEREQHLSFLEFNYMILQAYDFVELNKQHGCRLQIGGSDQWGNIVNGVELFGRITKCINVPKKKTCWKKLDYDNFTDKGLEDWKNNEYPDLKSYRIYSYTTNCEEQESVEYIYITSFTYYLSASPIFGLTTPLITTSSGAKMGKTADGAVWLSADKFSPYDYWQFWRNVEDKDVGRFLRLFTELDIAEIEKLEKLEGAGINDAKIVLANEATKICHGDDAAKHAFETARKVFEQGGVGGDLPTVEISKAELEAGIPAFKILHMANLVESGGEAKNLIKGGGAKINDIKISDIAQNITIADFNADGIIKLSAGKKKHALVKVK